MDIMEYLMMQYPWLLYVLGGLGIAVAGYGLYVKLTPGKEDDKRWEKIKSHKIFGPLIRIVSRQKDVLVEQKMKKSESEKKE